MLIKNLTFTSLLFSSLFLFNSCTEEAVSTTEPPIQEVPDDTEGDDNEDTEETIADGNEIIVDMSSNGGPDIAYWRGAQGPGSGGFVNSDNQRKNLLIHSQNGMRLYNGTRRLATDPRRDDFFFLKDDNGSYKLDADGDKIPATDPIPEYVDIKKYAHELGIELICMLDGTPSWIIEIDRDFHWGDPNFPADPENAITDHAPLPEPGKPMQQFQDLFIEFAKESDAAVAPDYHSIWIGTQEIAHTIGWRDGKENATNKQEAVRRYIDFWKPIADGLRELGKKVGGIQLNSSNTDLYEYSVDYMKQVGLKLDYITFQFYQWGREKAMLSVAAESVRKYQREMNMPDTKIIIDRGGFGKLEEEATSQSDKFIRFLMGEKDCMEDADVMYGYTLDCGVGTFANSEGKGLEWQTKYWLMNCGDPESPNKRRTLENLPEGVDGFMTTKGNNLYGVLWNRTDTGLNPQDIEIQLTNLNGTYSNEPTILKASGSDMTKIKCKFSNNIISGIKLYSGEYILIELKADQTDN